MDVATVREQVRETFRKNLNRIIEARGMKQAELAKLIGVSAPTVNDWVKGRKVPRMDKIDKLCSIFSVGRSDLLDEPKEISVNESFDTTSNKILWSIFTNRNLNGKGGISMTANKTGGLIPVVSYFCGCGGLDLGFRGDFRYHQNQYEKLPFDIKVAYDIDPRCIETYNNYFKNDRGVAADITTLNVEDVPQADVLIGGFPCQEFSSCGPLRGLDSERGRLYKTLVTYMQVHHPMIVVGENVINLERMQGGAVLEQIKKDLAEVGYDVRVWKMFAPDYGVPQTRTRLFVVCVRNDIVEKHDFPNQPEAKFKDRYRSIEWAIGDLVNVKDNSVPNQGEYFLASRAKKGNGQGDESNQKDKPAYTIRANPKSRVQFHYSLERRLTVRECARIQTFPDDFKFGFSKTVNVSQIGNAVPPILGHIVAREIAKYLRKVKGMGDRE